LVAVVAQTLWGQIQHLVQEHHHQSLLRVVELVLLLRVLLQEMVVLVEVLVVPDQLNLLVLQEFNQHNQILQQFYNMEILEEIKLVFRQSELQVVVVVPEQQVKQDQLQEQDQVALVELEDNIHNLKDLLLEPPH
jgi:hypothetical protein